MSSRIVNSRNLVSQESVQFIRPQTLTITLIESRPGTKMFVFFGDFDVTRYCYLDGNTPGTDIVTDSIGQAIIKFDLPGGTFNVGDYDIIITDSSSLSVLDTTGSVFGSARTAFSATGILEIYQPVQTTVTTRTVTVTKVDPLAQSFFTFGVAGGMCISSIEVFFQTKDPSIPVRCEIRPLINGYPASYDPPMDYIAVLAPADVKTSNDASLPSKFIFKHPIYCKEDGEFCFVLRSNSNNYNVFTSMLGENSIEDGKKIFDQPYVGSVFKSENAITWTAYQFEDVKFKINKAVFDTTSVGSVELAAEVPAVGAFGYQFSTVQGSTTVTYTHAQDHGLEPGSKLRIITRDDALFQNAIFNGIPHDEFNATHTVVAVVDRKTVQFNVATPATTTGTIEHSNIVTHISVVNGGINYSSSDTITAVGNGSGFSAQLVVQNGTIIDVNILNAGTGYTSPPQLIITTSTGTGASIIALVEPTFTVYTNKPMTGFIPKFGSMTLGDTNISMSLDTTVGNFDGGTLSTYTAGNTFSFIANQSVLNLNQNSLIASTFNEDSMMGGSRSAKLKLQLSTPNNNIAPVIDVKNNMTLDAYSFIINNQSGEVIDASASSGQVQNVVVTSGGSGYTIAPIVTFDEPQLSTGVRATGTAQLSGSVVTGITITNPGSGYTRIPLVTITRATGDITGIGAAAQARLSQFNTELLPSGGNAKSKYITKKTQMQIVSTGVRIYSLISSTEGSSIDFYIRTSLSTSGVDHDELEWRLVPCDIARNKSSEPGQFLEYEFKLDNIAEFDTYDLKCVFRSVNPTIVPVVKSYRVIVIA